MNPAQATNLSNLLAQAARRFPEHAGLIQGERSWTWSQLDARVDAMAAGLAALGIRKGDRILVHSRNTLQMFESCWVAFRLGCVWVPTNFRLAPAEVAYLAASSGARVMLYEDVFQGHADEAKRASPQLEHLVCIGEARSGEHAYEALVAAHAGARPEAAAIFHDDRCWLFYTSGTTGRPKAAALTHGQMTFVVTNHLADLVPGITEQDRSIAVAPLSHGAGIHAMVNVARGAATVLPESEKLDVEEFWRLVAHHRITNLFTVPTIVKMLVEHPAVDRHDRRSLRYLVYAGAPMYRSDQKRALEKLGPVLVQYFGLGEVTGCITVLPRDMHSLVDDDPAVPHGTCGWPRTGMEVAIFDPEMQRVPAGTVGEICCRGPAVFDGYEGNAEATARALRGGWFHTGDLGRLDERGLLYVTGRESDMYISGGSNVYPREVEEVLLSHPGVQEVAILGVPDAKWGEVGLAVVVARPGAQVGAEELLAHLGPRCARYRWPQRFVFWDGLPKNGYGKVAKKDIRAELVRRGQLGAYG